MEGTSKQQQQFQGEHGDDYDYQQDRNNSQNGESQEEEAANQMITQPSRKQPRLTDFPPPQVDNTQNQEEEGGVVSGGFTEDEIQNLKDIFDLFDKNRSGRIDVRDLEAIMTSLQRDPSEARQMLEANMEAAGYEGQQKQSVTFDEFINLMQQVENKLLSNNQTAISGGPDAPSSIKKDGSMLQHHQRNMLQSAGHQKGVISISPDSKVLDFLRLLEEYRRKCEEEGNYAEARKASSKFDELLKKEVARQRNNIRAAQEHELSNIEAAQKAQFVEFSQAWDHYMSDYEATAYLSLEKLKEKHMLEFEQFQERIRKELRAKMKFSKDLLELRDKEAKLVKAKRYEEAERVKMKADLLEEFERSKLEGEMQLVIDKKEAKLRHSQQLALAALLKRIQRDRNEQLKHRQQDSQRLIQRNKNILNDLLNKQNNETKKTLDHLKSTLGMTKMDMFYDGDAASTKKSTQLPQRAPSGGAAKKRTKINDSLNH